MPTEITVLTLAGLLQIVQFWILFVPANRELGTRYLQSARDNPPDQTMSVRTARLKRAMDNHYEGLILFTLAVVVVTLGQQSTTVTATCAWIYLLARVLYVPAYAFNLNPWRSIIWASGFMATTVMLLAALI